MKKENAALTRIVFGAVMAALVFVMTMVRVPLGESKFHLANSMCLLSGLLLGPTLGGTAAGLGSALYDVTVGGYAFFEALITFASKFAMAFVTGILYRKWIVPRKDKTWKENLPLLVLSCIIGSLTYVALYILKTWVFKMYVTPVPIETISTIIVEKLLVSLLNAAFAIVTAPIFYHAVVPALKAGGILKQVEAAAK